MGSQHARQLQVFHLTCFTSSTPSNPGHIGRFTRSYSTCSTFIPGNVARLPRIFCILLVAVLGHFTYPTGSPSPIAVTSSAYASLLSATLIFFPAIPGNCCEKCGPMGCFASGFQTCEFHVNAVATFAEGRLQIVKSLVRTCICFSFPPPSLHWARLRALALT